MHLTYSACYVSDLVISTVISVAHSLLISAASISTFLQILHTLSAANHRTAFTDSSDLFRQFFFIFDQKLVTL